MYGTYVIMLLSRIAIRKLIQYEIAEDEFTNRTSKSFPGIDVEVRKLFAVSEP